MINNKERSTQDDQPPEYYFSESAATFVRGAKRLGDEDLTVARFSEIKFLPLVIEEKIDALLAVPDRTTDQRD